MVPPLTPAPKPSSECNGFSGSRREAIHAPAARFQHLADEARLSAWLELEPGRGGRVLPGMPREARFEDPRGGCRAVPSSRRLFEGQR
jgi:hypothetical protein